MRYRRTKRSLRRTLKTRRSYSKRRRKSKKAIVKVSRGGFRL